MAIHSSNATMGAPTPQSDDPHADFQQAVANSQPMLALHYASMLIDDLYSQIEELSEQKKSSKKAPSRKTKKGNTPTKKDESKEEADTSDSDKDE